MNALLETLAAQTFDGIQETRTQALEILYLVLPSFSGNSTTTTNAWTIATPTPRAQKVVEEHALPQSKSPEESLDLSQHLLRLTSNSYLQVYLASYLRMLLADHVTTLSRNRKGELGESCRSVYTEWLRRIPCSFDIISYAC